MEGKGRALERAHNCIILIKHTTARTDKLYEVCRCSKPNEQHPRDLPDLPASLLPQVKAPQKHFLAAPRGSGRHGETIITHQGHEFS